MDITAKYTVKNNQLVLDHYDDLTDQEKAKHLILWKRVNLLIPDAYKKYIKSLEIGSDGENGILASVTEMEDLSKWSLFLDIKDSINDKDKLRFDFDYTLIHEFGHILTLNSSQITKNPVKGTYSTVEGDSKKDSYLNAFFNEFWSKDTFDNAYDRYDSNPESFISDYAATSIEEDIAESFARFVTGDKPLGLSVADMKINFFYKYEDLRDLRDEIRKNL